MPASTNGLWPDVLVIGGGSAGAVLAARLSEDRSRNVLLVEAGPNFSPGSYPASLTSAGSVASSEFDWHYQSDEEPSLGHRIPSPRGKVIGGSSAVNGTVAIRARPADFARWTARGIEGWSFDDVLPVYKALENTPSGDDRWHGRSGPFPIRQRLVPDLTPSVRAFIEASRARGLPPADDFNNPSVRGVGPYSLNVVDEVRMNCGMTYLTEQVRSRKNLSILADTEIDRLVFEGRRTVGVRTVSGRVIRGGTVILSAGAFGSPAILMRSGIGPAEHLRALGISVIADLPVGDRLIDHPFIYHVYSLKPSQRGMVPAAGALAWVRSASASNGDLDLQIAATHFFDGRTSPTGGAIVLASAVVLPHSSGTFRLTSADPLAPPRIRYNFLSDRRDLDRMAEVVRLSESIGRSQPFAGMIEADLTHAAPADELRLREYLLANVQTYAHPTSTVPMGHRDDSSAVVDEWGMVRDIEGLRVVDASIMPDIPSVPTNLTTIMLAERISARVASLGS